MKRKMTLFAFGLRRLRGHRSARHGGRRGEEARPTAEQRGQRERAEAVRGAAEHLAPVDARVEEEGVLPGIAHITSRR